MSTDARNIATSLDFHSLPNGKAAVVAPTVSTDVDVEMDDIPGVGDKLPLHEDIMQLSRLGEIGPIEKLFTDGKYKPDYRDEEGITPLHVRPSSRKTTRRLSYILTLLLVGSYQQPLRAVQIPYRRWFKRQC